jgi:hypothetical protein
VILLDVINGLGGKRFVPTDEVIGVVEDRWFAGVVVEQIDDVADVAVGVGDGRGGFGDEGGAACGRDIDYRFAFNYEFICVNV